MKHTVLRSLFPAALIFLLFSCSPDPIDKVPVANNNINNSVSTVNYDYSEDETVLVNIINDYRISIGLKKLELIDYVSYKSEEHDLFMIQNNEVSHAGFEERAEDIEKVLDAAMVSENIAYNYETSELALKAWLASPGHKANIEGAFTHFGISIRVNPTNGKKYYTNIFVNK